jgi:predicted transposase YbfD/YdcC
MIKMARRAKKLQELAGALDGLVIDEIEKTDVIVLKELSERANEMSDPRDEAYVRHKLGDIIMITLFAVIASADEWEKIEVFGKKKESWLRKFLELPYGIPTDDTYRIVLSKINVNFMYEIIVGFLLKKFEEIIAASEINEADESKEKELISCDGKESKSSKRKDTDKSGSKALTTLNAYSSDWGMCVGQEFIDEKSNEIPAMPRLLRRLRLKDTIVTWDALNTQKDTVRAVIECQGDYVGALKGNHGNLYADVKDYYDEETKAQIKKADDNREAKQYKKTVEKEHSAIVTREYYLEPKIGWLYGQEEWQGLSSIGLVAKKTEKTDGSEPTYEERYYICSITSVEDFAKAARGHWGVENGLHWHLDYTFKDDDNTTKRGNGAEGLQIMKKIALALLKVAQVLYPPRTSLKSIRYRLSLDYENEIERIFTVLNADNLKEALHM